MNIIKKFFILLLFSCGFVNGYTINLAHTWHTLHARSGEWSVSLKSINQGSVFVDANGHSIESASISPSQPLLYGFGFLDGSTFDLAYSLTVVQKETGGFQSKACVFVITAKSPAKPDVRALEYNGATCEWSRTFQATSNFYVS